MSYSGDRTSAYQQRVNVRNSRAKLAALLAANFGAGAQLVTLTYAAGSPLPSSRLASLRFSDWLRTARRVSSSPLRYIRATGQDPAGLYPVHRIVLTQSEATVAALAALWPYGPVLFEPVQKDAQETLVDTLIAPALHSEQGRLPCRHAWSSSIGLIRPRKEI